MHSLDTEKQNSKMIITLLFLDSGSQTSPLLLPKKRKGFSYSLFLILSETSPHIYDKYNLHKALFSNMEKDRKKLKRETHICHIYYQVTAIGENAQDMQVEKTCKQRRT